jgi:hypothetical protein
MEYSGSHKQNPSEEKTGRVCRLDHGLRIIDGDRPAERNTDRK